MWHVFRTIGGPKRSHRSKPQRPAMGVEGLERRELLTGGSVVGSGATVYVIPAPSGPNITTVSYQSQNGTSMVNVNLNGTNYDFNASNFTSLEYLGYIATGSQIFSDSTSLQVTAFGGSGSNLFEGGSGEDIFIGGTGSNTFDAGTGFDILESGFGSNTFNENASGSGMIEEFGFSNTINSQPGATGNYAVMYF